MQTPQSNLVTSSTLQKLPDGVLGIRETLRNMVYIAQQGKKSLAVRRLAMQILGNITQKSWIEEARALQSYVRDHVRYTLDINDIETLQTPDKTIEFNQGDCDDKAILVASLLEVAGHPARFVAVGQEPNIFEHVLVETKIANRWIGVETTEPVQLGWYPTGFKYRLVYNI
jgi:transglutaminase-like putative cysteine protease